ncbi:MAG: FAD binding domain-containing protein [Anaerolineales bacterium]|jgi:CO/xanthine dehydrogenase FAD-binding subunit
MWEFDYYRPKTVHELKENLSQPGAVVLAGGTDIIPKMRQRKFTPTILVDTSGIPDLEFIEDQGEQVVIGALTTHQQMAQSELIGDVNPALKAAVESIGCIQTRCQGTLGGNLANASPAADTVPALLIYDASILIQSLEGERTIPLESFVLGPGKTDLRQGEFIHSVSFPRLKERWGAAFIKVGKRTGMAISVVNTAAALILDQEGVISDARIALGAVGSVVIRCRQTENFLSGKIPGKDLFTEAGSLVREEMRPISDIRSTVDYRLHSASVILTRALETAAFEAERRNQ